MFLIVGNLVSLTMSWVSFCSLPWDHMNGRHLLTASVISVQNSNFVFPSCQNCFSKLYLDLKRYSCLKCGCSGDTKEANYRYRLSLEVADIRNVFEVTVFGSCLDTYFGITAKGLQRYIEELNQEAGQSDRDGTPAVVFEAVEICFVGKKFIFGVKNSAKPDDATSLQNDFRNARAFTACQMLIPDSELVGYTVIQLLQQHRCSSFKRSPRSIWPPDLFMAFGQSSAELSSLPSSAGLGMVPLSPISRLPGLSPLSFGLTSFSLTTETSADPTDLNSNKTAYEKQNWGESPYSLDSQSTSNPRDHNLIINKKNEWEMRKCHLYTLQWDHATAKSEPPSCSFSGRKDSNSLQCPPELEEKDSSSKIDIQHHYGLEKSWNSLPLQRNTSLCPLPLSSSHTTADALWDELPSSESLNEFIARIENDKAMVQPLKANACQHFPNNGVDEFCQHFDQSSKSGIFSGSFKAGRTDAKLQKQAEKVEMGKRNILAIQQVNLFSRVSSGKSHQEAVFNSSSKEANEKFKDLSSQHPVVLPHSSPAGVKPCHARESCQSTKEGVDQDVSSARNLHSSAICLPSISTNAHSNCRRNGDLAITDLTNIQEQRCSPTVSEKLVEACEGERELIPKVQKYNFRVSNVSSLPQDCPMDSYNASADLFDVGPRGTEDTVGNLNLSQTFLAQEHRLTPKCTASGSMPGELDACWNTHYRLSSCSMVTDLNQKPSTPVDSSISNVEYSLLGTLGFVPNSQSTPCTRTCQQVRLSRRKESNLHEMPLNQLPWISAKCKRVSSSLKNPLSKHLVSMFLQSRRSSSVNSASADAADPQQLINGCPALQLSENDGEEWISPSQKKWIQPLGKKLKRRRNLLWNNPDSQISECSPSENLLKYGIPSCSIRSEGVAITPKRQGPGEVRIGSQPIHECSANLNQPMKESAGFCAVADGDRLHLSSTRQPMPDAPNWSPELFSDNCQLPDGGLFAQIHPLECKLSFET
ncbi:DNA damage-induced apoptosis suppressor protein isoform X1 [Varanus komodoensis]|uniref:DNA damage-induced apoptosis suppressor protein isoform X1 n=2 Tax=Varanus komodoensis TaxID=61221 RepID=UPI001CF79F2D|nr:DNA damage-induced apoptosis suppressor protein isoform X1 [Varanus komodoensis]